MDLVTSLVGFCAVYTSLSLLNILLNTPPAHLSGKKRWDYLGQYISLVHACTAILLTMYVYCQENGVHYTEPTSYSHSLVISHSIGYFFYDMIFAEIVGIHDWAMRTHHCCILVGGTIMYMAESGGSAAILCILISEGSNPFMMLRKILRAKQQQETQFYKTIELIFVITFVFFRTVPGTFINYNMWVTDIYLVTKLAVSITYGVGFYWIYMIAIVAVGQLDETNVVGKLIRRVVGVISKNQMFFAIGIFVWAVLLPFYLTQIVKMGFINVRIGEFIVL